MALGPDNFNVTIALNSVFCFQGDDIDGFMQAGASEPYLWVIMFKIDGETLSQNGNFLTGKPAYFFSPGSQGNIGAEIYSGQTLHIPHAVGRWETSLRPIPITLAGAPITSIPGVIGCCAVLMEENMTPNSAVEAGHQSLNGLVRTTIENTIASLGLAGLAADAVAAVATAASGGVTLPIGTAVQQVLQTRLKPIVDLFTVASPATTTVAILKKLNLAGAIGSAIDADKPMGTYIRMFTQAELRSSYQQTMVGFPPGSIDINQHWWNMPEWAYTLHGEAFAHRKYDRKALPNAQRLEITCTSKRGVGGDRRINDIGGVHQGMPWFMGRGEAADAVRSGQRTFFTRLPSGGETEVVAIRGGVFRGEPWYFLQTQANFVASDNLLNLPDCPPHSIYGEVYY